MDLVTNKKQLMVMGTVLLTVAGDIIGVKSEDCISEGPLLFKACGTLGNNGPFVVAPLKGIVPQQTLWSTLNPFTEPHTGETSGN